MKEEIPFKTILEQTTDIVIVTEVEPLDEPFGPKIVYVNQAFITLTGYTLKEILGKTPRILQGEKTDKKVLRRIRCALEKKEVIHAELLNYAKDKTEYWLNFTIVPIKDNNGDIKYFAAIEHDVTERKKMEEAQAKLSILVEFSDEAIIGKNMEGIILSWNKAAEKLYGYRAQEIIGTNIKTLVPSNKQKEFQKIMQMLSKNKHIKHLETLRVHKDGHNIPVSLTIAPIKNAQELVVGATIIARDITQQKLMENKLKHLAEHDALTGLVNRSLFEDRLEQSILLAKRKRYTVAVCFMDIDNFKQINDIYGHTMGDLLICAAAKRLQSAIRETDTLARFGGDEFALILSNLHENKVIDVVKNIFHDFSKDFLIQDKTFQVTLSIGISVYPRDGNVLLIEKADAAMYYVKKHGKNNLKLYDDKIPFRED